MQFSFNVIGIFQKNIEIDTQNESIAIVNRENKDAAGLLIRKAIEGGSSVVVYGYDPDYYRYLLGVDPKYVYTLDYHDMQTDAKLPFFEGTCKIGLSKMRQSYQDYCFERQFDYLLRKDGMQFKDPGQFQSFFQIRHGNTAKEKVITESFLLNVLVQSAYASPIHEVLIVMSAPFRPITNTVINMFEHAPLSVTTVLLYRENKTNGETITLSSDGQRINLKTHRKSFEIIDEKNIV